MLNDKLFKVNRRVDGCEPVYPHYFKAVAYVQFEVYTISICVKNPFLHALVQLSYFMTKNEQVSRMTICKS